MHINKKRPPQHVRRSLLIFLRYYFLKVLIPLGAFG